MTADFNVILNFNSAKPVITGAQFKAGDKGFTINMDVRELDPTGMTPKIAFYRSNGTSVESSSVTNVGNIFSYTLLGNELAVPGVVVADLKFYDGDDQRISSASFIFTAISDTLDGLGGGTESYSDELEQLSAEFQDTLDDYIDAFGNTAPINPRGDYDNTATYEPRDMVYDPNTGTSWVCKQQSTGNAPGSPSNYWQQVLASASASNFGDLADVDMTGVQDGQVPAYDANSGKYKPTTPSAGGVTSFNGRTGAVSPAAGDYSFAGLSDTNMTGVQNGQVPTYNSSTQKYEPSTPSGGSSTFAGLSDVSLTTPTNGQVPTYDAAEQKWKNATPITGGILPHLIVTAASGSTVTATLGGTTISLTETSTGKFEGDLTAYGTWTIAANTSGATSTESINVDTVKIYSIEIATIPDGSTVTPTDDIQIWLHCADIWDKAYTTIAAVLADTTTLSALINDNNAADYMARSTTWASDVCADSTAMSYIGLDNYCSNTLLGDNTWLTAIVASSYMESILNVKVPTMTSNTTPRGIAFSDAEQAGYETWKAFDGDVSTQARSETTTAGATDYYCGYEFEATYHFYYATCQASRLSSAAQTYDLDLQAYVSGSWVTLETYEGAIHDTNASFTLNGVATTKLRVKGVRVLSTYDHVTYFPSLFKEIQFYGREDV